jgi:uncharacterized protein YjbI with pentapeptide repeats
MSSKAPTSKTQTPKVPKLPTELVRLADQTLDDGSDISDSLLSGDFSSRSCRETVVEQCRVSRAQFTGTELQRARFIDVVIEKSDFSGADLDEVSFTRVEFRDCRLSGAILTRCNLRDVLVSHSRMDGASFRMTAFHAVTFETVDLTRSDFYATTFENARFFDCDLTEAEFSKASAPGVRFHGSKLFDLKGARYLEGAVIDSSQVLPLALAVFTAHHITIDDEREP